MWRRLYLDTADLIEIGDGRVGAQGVAQLVAAMAEARAALVVSREHLLDVSRGGPSAVESLVVAVEAFPHVLIVTDGPDAVEPLTAERADIGLALASNFRDLAYSKHAPKGLAATNATTDILHAARAAAQRAVSSQDIPAVRSKTAFDIARQGLITLVRGWMGDLPDRIVSSWEERLSVELRPFDREAILARLGAARLMLAELRQLVEKHSVDMAEALRLWAAWDAEPQRWPGHALALKVSEAQGRNDQRKPRRSDLLDLGHVTHFPYVDIATCDSSTLAALRGPSVGTIASPRSPVLVNNRRLSEVVAALRLARDG